MPFSILLLTAASSERHITGAGSDRVVMKEQLQSNEVVLFFDRVDSEMVRRSLGIAEDQKCCDGVIFYTCGERKVICLVEMKSSNIKKAEEQIKITYQHLYKLLEKECAFCKGYFKQIIWQAYVYRAGSAPERDTEGCVKALEGCFKKGNVVVLGNPDITAFLRGEERMRGNRKK